MTAVSVNIWQLSVKLQGGQNEIEASKLMLINQWMLHLLTHTTRDLFFSYILELSLQFKKKVWRNHATAIWTAMASHCLYRCLGLASALQRVKRILRMDLQEQRSSWLTRMCYKFKIKHYWVTVWLHPLGAQVTFSIVATSRATLKSTCFTMAFAFCCLQVSIMSPIHCSC